MRRGTTPTLTLLIHGIDVSDMGTIFVTFEQGSKEVTKTGEDISVDTENNAITIAFSQEDTLAFGVGNIDVQIRALLKDGETAIASKIKRTSMERILLEGKIKEASYD